MPPGDSARTLGDMKAMPQAPGEGSLKGSPNSIDAPSVDRVGTLARHGAAWTFVQTMGSQVLSVVSTTVLARILVPSDYGIIGMVATLTALLTAVAGMGLSWSTIQRKDLTLTQVHNLFWLSAGFGFVLWGLSALSAPLLADFYDQPKVAPVAVATGATFAISGLASQPMALLSRAMRFRLCTWIELGAHAVGSTTAIVLAINGAGYWALVASTLMGQGVRLILAHTLSGYRPGRPQRDPATMAMVTFGGYLVASNVMTYVFRNADNILIGRVWGAQELGYYTRAYFLMTVPAGLFTSALNRVMVPALSALAHDTERMGSAYRQAIRTLGFVGFPVAVGLAVTAPEAVRLIYGPNWGPVVPILAVLSLSMVTQVIGGTFYWLYTAAGKGRLQFLVTIVATLASVAGMFVGVRFGPIGVATAFAVASALILLPNWYIGHRAAGFNFVPTLKVVRPLFVASLSMGLLSLIVGLVVDAVWGDWLLTLLAKITIGVVAYGAIAVTFLAPWPIPALENFRRRTLTTLRSTTPDHRQSG